MAFATAAPKPGAILSGYPSADYSSSVGYASPVGYASAAPVGFASAAPVGFASAAPAAFASATPVGYASPAAYSSPVGLTGYNSFAAPASYGYGAESYPFGTFGARSIHY